MFGDQTANHLIEPLKLNNFGNFFAEKASTKRQIRSNIQIYSLCN